MESTNKHWDTIFSTTEDANLGWFEKDMSKTYELLHQIPHWENATIFIPGAGTSGLIEDLFSKGAKLVVNDISMEAINLVKSRLGDKSETVLWLCQDIAIPLQRMIPKVDIWIDRAVLHFLTNEDALRGYFDNLKSVLKVGGYALFAEFSKTGAPQCAGLTLNRYSVEELSERLGNTCTLITHFDYTFINPHGDPKPYIYALYKRVQ